MFDPRITVANWPTSVQGFAFRGEKVSPPSLPPSPFCEFPNQTTRGEEGKRRGKKEHRGWSLWCRQETRRGPQLLESFPETGKQFIKASGSGGKKHKGKIAWPWSRALGPYRFWARPSTFPSFDEFYLREQASWRMEKLKKWNERRGGSRADLSFFFYLFNYLFTRRQKHHRERKNSSKNSDRVKIIFI